MNNMNNANKKSFGFNYSFVVAWAFFAIAFLANVTAFNFVARILGVMQTFSYVTALLVAVLICVRYSKKSRLKNPNGFDPPRDAFYYMKRMGFIVLITVLMSTGASLIGGFVNALFGGFLQNSVYNVFLRGFILKLPIFALYLSFIYKMFIRYGYMDSDRKIFNPDFKMLSVIVALIIMIPNAVYDSMFFTSPSDMAGWYMVNVQTLLSPNIDKFIIESDGWSYVNENFTAINIILVFITVLLTFAIQAGVAVFAYRRGKKIFMKQRIRIIEGYEMDENI